MLICLCLEFILSCSPHTRMKAYSSAHSNICDIYAFIKIRLRVKFNVAAAGRTLSDKKLKNKLVSPHYSSHDRIYHVDYAAI